jgi:serine/threonine protein phosphatase 1
MRLYCVGDIHGRDDLLRQMHRMIAADSTGYAGIRKVVYLGDYVDRGDASRQVIERLIDAPLEEFESIFLRGNHEQAMLDFLDFPDRASSWLSFGGLETLLSYGIKLDPPSFAPDFAGLAERFQQLLPDSHRGFIGATRLMHREGDYCFVHAGIRPGIRLEQQHPDDLLWIRKDFIDHTHPHPCVVVHGHTITNEPELLSNRIGLDTGAYFSGVLSCLVLEAADRRVLQTA